MSQEPLTKMRAVAYISIETSKSLRVAQKALEDMEASGEITLERSPYSPTILISRDDIQKVIDRLKNGQ
jgi:hypothetical protein